MPKNVYPEETNCYCHFKSSFNLDAEIRMCIHEFSLIKNIQFSSNTCIAIFDSICSLRKYTYSLWYRCFISILGVTKHQDNYNKNIPKTWSLRSTALDRWPCFYYTEIETWLCREGNTLSQKLYYNLYLLVPWSRLVSKLEITNRNTPDRKYAYKSAFAIYLIEFVSNAFFVFPIRQFYFEKCLNMSNSPLTQ